LIVQGSVHTSIDSEDAVNAARVETQT